MAKPLQAIAHGSAEHQEMGSTGRAGRLRRPTACAREALWGLLFVSPILLGVILWFIVPLGSAVYISLTNWTLLKPPKVVGLANFSKILQDRLVWQALKVTTIYTLASVPMNLLVAMAVALLLNSSRSKTMYLFRVLYYLPSLVPPVANAVLWSWLLNSEYGLVNWALRSVGVPGVLWLQDTRTALPSLIIMSVWGFGSTMVIFLAGLQSIPQVFYEAAKIDGAGLLGRLHRITIPLMSPVIFFNFVMNVIGSFQAFTAGYLITDGGPKDTTLFFVLHLYRNAFQYLKMGYACAMAWVLFLIITLLTVVVFRYFGRTVYYLGS